MNPYFQLNYITLSLQGEKKFDQNISHQLYKHNCTCPYKTRMGHSDTLTFWLLLLHTQGGWLVGWLVCRSQLTVPPLVSPHSACPHGKVKANIFRPVIFSSGSYLATSYFIQTVRLRIGPTPRPRSGMEGREKAGKSREEAGSKQGACTRQG